MIQYILTVLIVTVYAWLGKLLFEANHWLLVPYILPVIIVAYLVEPNEDVWNDRRRRLEAYRQWRRRWFS